MLHVKTSGTYTDTVQSGQPQVLELNDALDNVPTIAGGGVIPVAVRRR
jgi:hypothetical protein